MVPRKSTAEEVSFDWSHHRISSRDSKARTYNYVTPLYQRKIKNNGTVLDQCTEILAADCQNGNGMRE